MSWENASKPVKWKLENPDFRNSAQKFQISKNFIFHLNDHMQTEKFIMKLLKDFLSNGPHLVSPP